MSLATVIVKKSPPCRSKERSDKDGAPGEVVLKETPVKSENGFIPLGALAKLQAPKPAEIGEPVAGD